MAGWGAPCAAPRCGPADGRVPCGSATAGAVHAQPEEQAQRHTPAWPCRLTDTVMNPDCRPMSFTMPMPLYALLASTCGQASRTRGSGGRRGRQMQGAAGPCKRPPAAAPHEPAVDRRPSSAAAPTPLPQGSPSAPPPPPSQTQTSCQSADRARARGWEVWVLASRSPRCVHDASTMCPRCVHDVSTRGVAGDAALRDGKASRKWIRSLMAHQETDATGGPSQDVMRRRLARYGPSPELPQSPYPTPSDPRTLRTLHSGASPAAGHCQWTWARPPRSRAPAACRKRERARQS